MKTIKIILFYFFSIYLVTVGVPFAAGLMQNENKPIEVIREEVKEDVSTDTNVVIENLQDNFILKDSTSGEIITLSNRDFLIGSLISEMSPTVPIEALKAQTVASFSYYSHIRDENSAAEFHLSFDSALASVYVSPESKRSQWGENFDSNMDIYSSAVDSVLGQKLTYEGVVAVSSFFSVSNGNTESALDMWGEDIPYLVSVASPYDSFSGGKENIYTFSPEEIIEIVTNTWPYANVDYNLPKEEWFSEIEYTFGGTVTNIRICGFMVLGEEIRNAFSISSPCFDVSFDGANFIFRSSGSGSLVGMSQTGAAYMASEGATYQEILSWYYPGTTLV